MAQQAEADFDPLERERLRQLVERYDGDRLLLTLSDEELDGALGFIHTEGQRRVATVAGILVLGPQAAFSEHLPTHEAAFQVLDGTQVQVERLLLAPLLKTFERIMEQIQGPRSGG